jgi:hypothetical protein
MSSPGQIIGGVVGAVAGFFLSGFNPTGAIYGAQLGMMAGGAIDPPKGPTVEGPRLSDLTVQTSNYGASIPRVYGTAVLNGNVIWLEGNRLKESVTKTKSGGKGGSKSKTTTRNYSYSATFAVGLCQGPIAGVRRIWIGPQLIYHAGATDPGTIVASNEAAQGFALYLGNNTQQPDPRIQADVGVANAPAWRGLAYLVFYDLELASYGNSLAGAQVRVEVIQPTATEAIAITTTSTSSAARTMELAWRGESITGIGFRVVDSQYVIERLVATPSSEDVAISTTLLPGYGAGTFPHTVRGNPALLVALIAYSGSFLAFFDDQGNEVGTRIRMDSPFTSWAGGESPIAWNAASGRMMMLGSLGAGVSHYASASTGSGAWETLITYAAAPIKFYAIYGCSDGQTYAKAPGDLLYRIDANYNVLEGPWTYPTTRTFLDRAGSHFYFCNSLQTTLYEHTFDGSTYNLGSGVASVVGGFGTWCYIGDRSWWLRAGGTSFTFASFSETFSPRTNGLNAIVSAECLQSGILTAGDIDVTGLAGKSVRGVTIARSGSIRSAIEPLQAVWPFDVQAHGYQIRFVPRGGASVATIPAIDLDARQAGQAPGVSLTTRREMDTQMPRRVVVKHFDQDREYNLGEQYAERLNTAAINVTTLDLAIALTAGEAAGVAEVLLYLAWLERYAVTFVLPPSYGQLEVADVISLETPEGYVSLRLTACNTLSDQRIECEARYAAAAIYTPTATGASSAVTGATTIALRGITQAVFLDIPLVHEMQNSFGLPVAMAGVSDGWPGGSLYQSADGGSTWSDLADAGAPGATIGTATNALAAVDSRLLDSRSLLAVTLATGDLYSVSLLNLLNGSNTMAYGANGRWEILGAMTCTPGGGNAYVLSNLLRGRFGTEWAMGLHVIGDTVVLLDDADLQWLAMSSSAISQARLYRAITFGNDIGTDSDRSFTYSAVNLKPLAPIALTGARNPASNDWSLTWLRRTRSGGEWRDSMDVDLGETSERYEVEIYASGAYASVKRILSTTSQSAAYTSADQVTDFGSNQATLYLKIYQLSDSIGRGYPLTASLTR